MLCLQGVLKMGEVLHIWGQYDLSAPSSHILTVNIKLLYRIFFKKPHGSGSTVAASQAISPVPRQIKVLYKMLSYMCY